MDPTMSLTSPTNADQRRQAALLPCAFHLERQQSQSSKTASEQQSSRSKWSIYYQHSSTSALMAHSSTNTEPGWSAVAPNSTVLIASLGCFDGRAATSSPSPQRKSNNGMRWRVPKEGAQSTVLPASACDALMLCATACTGHTLVAFKAATAFGPAIPIEGATKSLAEVCMCSDLQPPLPWQTTAARELHRITGFFVAPP